MATRDLIERAFQSSDTELLRELGARAYILDGELILKKSSPDPDRDEQNGRKILDHLRPNVELVLCERWRACDRLGQFPDETALAVAVADTLIANNVAPLSIAALAVLIVRIGIKRFCACT